MTPEGLQYSSIADAVTKIKSLGMNVVRLTYAIQMIDEYYENGEKDSTFLSSFVRALGSKNGTRVFRQIVGFNPQFNENSTRLDVFDAIAAECFKQEIYVHLDNHMSQAYWCCNTGDGNSWFGDVYFNINNWRRGLNFMATHGAKWGSMLSMSLRNELRSPDNNAALLPKYNWENWYANVVPAMNGIHAANKDVLIFMSGLGFDTTMAPITTGANLGSGTTFDKTRFAYADKLVVELHNYQTTATDCAAIKRGLYDGGYNAMNLTDARVKNHFPVVLTEFGHAQTPADYATVYSTCLKDYLGGLNAGWMYWVLSGTYYIREGRQDADESWGLLNHDWTAWRDPASIARVMIPMVKETLS